MEWVCPLTKEADQQLAVSMRKLPYLRPGTAPMSKKLGHFIARLRPFRRQYMLNHSKGLQSRNLCAKTALLEILGGKPSAGLLKRGSVDNVLNIYNF